MLKFGPSQLLLLFLVGIWAGLIVLDSYTYLLLTLVLSVGYDLVHANAEGWFGAQLAASERSKVWTFRILVATIAAEIVRMV